MNIQRFHAPTAREALALARAAFGDATLILSNRQTSTGVEVMASTEEALSPLGVLQSEAQPPSQAPAPQPLAPSWSAAPAPQAERRPAGAAPSPYALVSTGGAGATTEEVVQADVEQLAMSTLSFQDYVRERMLRRQTESNGAASMPSEARGNVPQPQPQPQPQAQPQYRLSQPQQPQQVTSPQFNDPAFFAAPAAMPASEPAHAPMQAPMQAPMVAAPQYQPEPMPVAFERPAPMAFEPVASAFEPEPAFAAAREDSPPPAIVPAPRPAEPASAASAVNVGVGVDATRVLMAELDAMKRLMEERFNTLSWLGNARRDPVHSNLMLKLVRAGYSPALAREVLEPLANVGHPDDAVDAMLDTLERRLGIDTYAQSLVEEGGTFALIGATGVGKTTTIAKLASQCAGRWGAASVGLVTLDVQRAGAHEQLRAFGRELGIVAHQAHDRAELQEMLSLLSGKRLVLVDTAGIAPRDPQRRDLLDLIDVPGVKRVVVLNAGAHGDTLDEIATAFTADGTHQAVLTKIDEAAKIGPALDALMRHRMTLRGVTDGQRVPQDWKAANARELVDLSMRSGQRTPIDPVAADMDFYFSPAACAY